MRVAPPSFRRLATELALLGAVGLAVAYIGPYSTADMPLSQRLTYWLILIVGGGIIGIGLDAPVRRRLPGFWRRLLAVSALMTPPIFGLVVLLNHVMYGEPLRVFDPAGLALQVFVLSLGTMALRQLSLDRLSTATRADDGHAEAGREDPTAAFRRRLSARRRPARLIAVEAEDHYLRVHTDAGAELVTARFADAMAELGAAPGFRTHRSWWVAADAIEEVRWRRGSGEARLTGGLTVPVSRSQAGPLKAAGWF